MSSKIYTYNGVNSYLPPSQARPSNNYLIALNAKPSTHKLKQSSFRVENAGGSFLSKLFPTVNQSVLVKPFQDMTSSTSGNLKSSKDNTTSPYQQGGFPPTPYKGGRLILP